MEFTFYKARLKTSGKTPEQIKSDFEGGVGPEPSEEEIKSWIKAYNLIHGVELVVVKTPFGDGYTPVSWNKNDDGKIRDFIYQAEQDPIFGTYIDEREEFLKDWDSEEYSPAGSLAFDCEDVEIIEEMKKKQS